MQQIIKLLDELQTIARDPGNSVKINQKKTGRVAIGCFPYYAPEEIVYAAGFLPVGLWGGQSDIQQADAYLQSFCCSIMRENLELGLKGVYKGLAAVIMPIYCDTLKCISDNWKAAFPETKLIPIVYPQNRGQAGATYLLSEYIRIKDEVSEIAGHVISEADLEASLDIYEEYRQTMIEFTQLVKQYPLTLNASVRHLVIKAGYFSDKKIYTQKIRKIIDKLKSKPVEKFSGSKVVVTGILTEPESLLEAFAQNNISFVADDLAQESRSFRNRITGSGTVLEKLVRRFIVQQCSLLHDDKKQRGQLLIDMVRENGADGVVVALMKFCEPEEFDYPIYKKELEKANIPVLYLEIEQKIDSIEQIRTRIQSFAEMLQ